jgi:hypothetical protein
MDGTDVQQRFGLVSLVAAGLEHLQGHLERIQGPGRIPGVGPQTTQGRSAESQSVRGGEIPSSPVGKAGFKQGKGLTFPATLIEPQPLQTLVGRINRLGERGRVSRMDDKEENDQSDKNSPV